ncbi:hypothetical protein, partial [Allobaculum mucilyticum]|uniref:hypothetical protein n=1 Tax=Allobaculum mucilyticum TaxID=2834459 RepID=UPI001E385964
WKAGEDSCTRDAGEGVTKTGSATPLLDWGPSAAAPIQANPDQSAHGVMGKRNRMKVAKRMERLSRKAS